MKRERQLPHHLHLFSVFSLQENKQNPMKRERQLNHCAVFDLLVFFTRKQTKPDEKGTATTPGFNLKTPSTGSENKQNPMKRERQRPGALNDHYRLYLRKQTKPDEKGTATSVPCPPVPPHPYIPENKTNPMKRERQLLMASWRSETFL